MQNLSWKERQKVSEDAREFYNMLSRMSSVDKKEYLLCFLSLPNWERKDNNKSPNNKSSFHPYAGKIFENDNNPKRKYFWSKLMEIMIKKKNFLDVLDQKEFLNALQNQQNFQKKNIKFQKNRVSDTRRKTAARVAMQLVIGLFSVLTLIMSFAFAGSALLLCFGMGLSFFIPTVLVVGITAFILIVLNIKEERSLQKKILAAVGVLLLVGFIAATAVGFAFVLPLIAPVTLGLLAAIVGATCGAMIVFLMITKILSAINMKLFGSKYSAYLSQFSVCQEETIASLKDTLVDEKNELNKLIKLDQEKDVIIILFQSALEKTIFEKKQYGIDVGQGSEETLLVSNESMFKRTVNSGSSNQKNTSNEKESGYDH